MKRLAALIHRIHIGNIARPRGALGIGILPRLWRAGGWAEHGFERRAPNIKRPSQHRTPWWHVQSCKPPSLTLTLSLGLCLAACAVGAAEPAAPEGTRVGDLGRPEALEFEGNATFGKSQILEGMSFHLDYYAAAHRAAPLADYLDRIERKITLGYQRCGFPEAKVAATADLPAGRVRVQITEGPRFECGDVLLSGVPSMTNDLVRQKITEELSGMQPGPAGSTNWDQAVWLPWDPAPFDEFSLQELTYRVREALAKLNYFQPAVSVRLAPDPARQRADLQVDIADEGMKGVIEEIEVTGLRTNTPRQVLEFLELKSGMELRLNLLGAVSNQLWQSGRFFYQEASLAPLPAVGKFKLTLDLEELREAPPLDQEFSPETRALLKFRDWLADLRQRPEDLVYSLVVTSRTFQVRGDLVFSPSGLALAVRADASNGPPTLKYAFVMTPQVQGYYSSWRGRKLVYPMPDEHSEVSLFCEIGPNPEARAEQTLHFNVGAGFFVRKASDPVNLQLRVVPVAVAREAARMNAKIQDGALTIRDTNLIEGVTAELKIEAGTGRLMHGLAESTNGYARLTAQEGAFAGLLREIATATASHPNDYMTNHGLASWISFMATDLIEAPIVDVIFETWMGELPQGDRPTNSLALLRKVRTVAAQARLLLGHEILAGVLEPLGKLLPAPPEDGEDTELFKVPRDVMYRDVDPNLLGIASIVLFVSDKLLTRDSWPWVLLRETAFNLVRQGRYTESELDRLRNSEEMGPAGCLATALLVGQIDPKLARTFAELGLSRLDVQAFAKDYRVWFNPDSILGELGSNLLGVFGGLSETQVAALSVGLPADPAALLRRLAGLIREGAGRPAGETAWPAVEQYWDQVLQPCLEAGLNHFLPQAPFLSDPKALFERGLAVMSPDALLQDVDEAVQCFTKAAEGGHAGAQLRLGFLYETGKGVPRDYAQAMHWYRQALEGKEPHAACRIGDLFFDGLGVPKNLDQAAEWYLQEAEGNHCPGAQFKLGRIFEERRQMPEALSWYRRGAEGGLTPAQLHLASILCDGFSTPPDYQEAFQWLLLASETKNDKIIEEKKKIIEIDLRRLKAKLTTDQIGQARQRADAIRQRLEEKKDR